MGKYLIGIIIIIGLSVSTYHFWNLYKEKNTELSEALKKNKIAISETILQDVTVLEFLKVTSNFTYYHEKKYPAFAFFKDTVQVIYKWPYSFTYGFDLTGRDWNWCTQIIDEEKGIIQVNAPDVVMTNNNPPSPTVEKSFRKPSSSDSLEIVSHDILSIAQGIINDTAEVHLAEANTNASITNAFSKHIQGLFNAFGGNARPITEVVIRYTDQCNKKD